MIQLTLDGGVARLVLDRPQVRNALAVEHWQALADAATHAAASGAHLLLLSGADGAFCAGADLSEFGEFQADESARARFRTAMRTGLEAVAALPLATIAWIDGPCFGAGVALAMAADIRIAAPTASFAITPAKIGIGYPQEDVARLVALVGPGWAARLLFTGDVITAQTAERIGLVEEATDPAGCEALVQAVLACDTDSVRHAEARHYACTAQCGLGRGSGSPVRPIDGFSGPHRATVPPPDHPALASLGRLIQTAAMRAWPILFLPVLLASCGGSHRTEKRDDRG
jgi:enoyl-CoA hydratase/carnithine racemase